MLIKLNCIVYFYQINGLQLHGKSTFKKLIPIYYRNLNDLGVKKEKKSRWAELVMFYTDHQSELLKRHLAVFVWG